LNRILPFVFSCLLFIAGHALAADPPAASPPPALRAVSLLESGQPVRIVCFGDSVTGVYYHTGGRRAWCDLVGLALRRLYPGAHVEMINAGVSGNNTSHALQRMEADVLRHDPQLVLVMFGLNDVVGITPEGFRANLGQIVQRARQRGAEVILMTPNAVSPGDSARTPEKVAAYAQITREVGRELLVPVADTYQAFHSVQTADNTAWVRLMSDAIHPNMRGHKLLAAEAVLTLTGRRAPLADLPRLQPGLPRLLARLAAHEAVRIVAMKPYDTLISPALRKLYPDARIDVAEWDATGKSVAEIEAQARSVGWSNYRAHPDLTKPDLFIVAVPAEAAATSDAQFVHDYTWIINWSLSFGQPGWNCLVILPSVAQPDQDEGQRAAERQALDVIQGQDVPWLQRSPGNRAPAAELLDRELARLLEGPQS
jgi:lysophospholipase L1-like esterase